MDVASGETVSGGVMGGVSSETVNPPDVKVLFAEKLVGLDRGELSELIESGLGVSGGL